MTHTQTDLYEYFGADKQPNVEGLLTSYIRTPIDEVKPKIRPAIVVIPGGGCVMRSKRESEPVALRFLSDGYAVFVLDYTVSVAHPTPLAEACMAVAYIRENASSLGVDGEHIAVIGFSAGGHIAASLATLYNSPEVHDALGKHSKNARPDAVILSYPVISMSDGITHDGTRSVITGGDKSVAERLSLENRVTAESVPAFIWHTAEDDAVSVENSLLMADAYRKAKVPFSLHIFEKGLHGLSLCDIETNIDDDGEKMFGAVGAWTSLALKWLFDRGFVVKSVDRR